MSYVLFKVILIEIGEITEFTDHKSFVLIAFYLESEQVRIKLQAYLVFVKHL